MTTYAIGDVQGCYEPLCRLLERLRFDPAADRLLFAGDLVNRGPQSLETLRFVRGLGEAAITVLGNHDLHLLACVRCGHFRARDTLDAIIHAPDAAELLDWLRRRPLAYREAGTGALLVHAGVVPQWSAEQALALAREAEQVLGGPGAWAFFEEMYGDEPASWDETLSGVQRLRFIINCLTRLRYCTAEGRMDLHQKGPPGSQPPRLMPWFEVPWRRTRDHTIIFGHWSTLGRISWQGGKALCLDTGCVWGRQLTALNLQARELVQVGCA